MSTLRTTLGRGYTKAPEGGRDKGTFRGPSDDQDDNYQTRDPIGCILSTFINQETSLAAYFPHLSIKRHHWLHTIHIQQTRDLIGCVLSAFNKQETSLAVSYPHSTNKRPHWLRTIHIHQTSAYQHILM